MLHASTKWIAPILAVLALTAVQAPSARAGFTLTIQEDNDSPIVINSGDPLFDSSLTPDTISVITTTLNTALKYFSFASLSATSSETDQTGPLSPATLTQGGEVQRALGSIGTHTLTITASDTFDVPQSVLKALQSSASDSYKLITVGALRTFQSIFDATASGGSVIKSPPTPFQLPPNLVDPGSDAVTTSTDVSHQPTPFVLTNVTTIKLGPDGSLGRQDYVFGGVSAVTPVPEPSSFGLGLISLPALIALGRRMRRQNMA